ncbi:sulfite exporter TauE/SafE family protein [bacterium]|nr:sulfite exporter TauE/SafE family protein [bacterium]
MFAAAALYSSVGHAGASGYLAVMALFSFEPVVMKPTALALNIVVAAIGTWRFYQAGFFSWKLFFWFAAASIPMAYIGGAIDLHISAYKILVGVVLLFAAFRLFVTSLFKGAEVVNEPPRWASLIGGAGIGLLSGLTGVGGGIFLTPLLILFKWSTAKTAAAVSVTFILVNSIAGLAGNWKNANLISEFIPYFAAAVVAGGLVGTYLGTQRFDTSTLRRVLAVVLVFAGTKMILL